MKHTDLITGFKLARKAATPLIGINSFDPEATMALIQKSLTNGDEAPMVQWDVIRGYRQRNDKGKNAVNAALEGSKLTLIDTQNPTAALEIAHYLPEDTVLFIQNAQHHLKPDKAKPDYVQALWNLRDAFKSNGRTLVLLANQLQLPGELQQDVLILDEKLPDDETLAKIITDMANDNNIGVKINMELAVDALRGLAAFPAEQAVAMNMTKNGLDISGLWERKRQLINETPGLSVWMGGQKFEDLEGLDEIKARFKRILAGRKPPRVIVWMDEIEKSMSGSSTSAGDTSGTSQDQAGVLLSEIQDKEYSGVMFVGASGAAKSAFAKAIANEAGILTIKLDLGEMKGQFVGLSEERIRHAMKIIEAVAGIGGAFFVATSNDIRAVTPELKRRFKKGIYFFDLPTLAERKLIWSLYMKKYELVDNDFRFGVDDLDWTGAEIEACCMTAWEEMIPISEAAKGIIPVAISGAKELERLRTEADCKYNSVTHPGPYVRSIESAGEDKPLTKRRLAI